MHMNSHRRILLCFSTRREDEVRKTTDEELSILKWTENTKGHPRVEDCRDIAEYDIVSGLAVDSAIPLGLWAQHGCNGGCTVTVGRRRAPRSTGWQQSSALTH